jgi:hypothetical protein
LSKSSNQLLLDELGFAGSKIAEEVEAGRNVGIQCRNGRSRSPTAVASYLINHKETKYKNAKEKLDKVMKARYDSPEWRKIDRQDRFKEHLQALEHGKFTYKSFSKWRTQQVEAMPRSMRSTAEESILRATIAAVMTVTTSWY